MDHEIQAIFENGVFRPLEPLATPQPGESFVVVRKSSITPAIVALGDASALQQQQAAIKLLFAQAESLPLEIADDNFSGADHDAALYGNQR